MVVPTIRVLVDGSERLSRVCSGVWNAEVHEDADGSTSNQDTKAFDIGGNSDHLLHSGGTVSFSM